MQKFILGRLRNAFVLLVLASILCFGLVIAAPGNIAVLIAEIRTPASTVDDVKKVELELGLNDPIPVRYYNWLKGVPHGDLGVSYKTGVPVGDSIKSRLSTSATLLAGAGVVALLLSLALGFVGAMRPYGLIDNATRGLALLGASTPSFFVGAMLIYLFAVRLHWLPSFGTDGPTSWLMPWFTLGLLPACVLSRIVRVGLEEAMTRPFIVTARSKGLKTEAILFRDALPNILPAYITAWGAQAASMTVGLVVVEPLFSWPGIGDLFLEGVRFRDFMVVQAGLLIFILFFIVLNLAVDIAVMLSDPKLRRQGSRA